MGAIEPQLDTRRVIVTSHAAVTKRVQRALAAADLPPLTWFELLSAVKRSLTGRPRMSDLAAWLTLSRGGITKLANRLQEAELITTALLKVTGSTCDATHTDASA